MDDRGSTSQDQPPDSDATQTATRDPVVSTVIGDRCCTACGFNLIGAPIIRESHYSMLIIRCPECGTCAAVQEYPLLGRWTRRFAALMAAMLLLVMLGAAAGSVGLVQVQSWWLGEEASWDLAGRIGRTHDAWFGELPTTERDRILRQYPLGRGWMGGNQFSAVLVEWWESEGDRSVYTSGVGFWSEFDPQSLQVVPWLVLTSLGIGAFWSIALVYQRRIVVMILVCVFAIVGGAIVGFGQWHLYDMSSYLGQGWRYAYSLAYERVGVPVAIAAAALMLVFMCIGAWLGRPVTRFAVCLLLPPRLRGPLAILWTAEGKAPPTRSKFGPRATDKHTRGE